MAGSKPPAGDLALATLLVFVRGVVDAGTMALRFVETATAPAKAPSLRVVPTELDRRAADEALRRRGL
jgi:hypothetical protein